MLNHCRLAILSFLVAIPACSKRSEVSSATSRPTPPKIYQSPQQQHRDKEHNAILDFYDQTLIKPYESVGHHSDRWDANARAALSGLVDSITAETPAETLAYAQAAVTHADAAISAGCDDGAVLYAAARLHEYAGQEPNVVAGLYRNAVSQLQKSHYPPIRLAYCLYRFANANRYSEIADNLKKSIDDAIDLLPAIASDPVIPNPVLADLCKNLIDLRQQITGDRLPGFQHVDAILAKAKPDSYILHLNRGQFYVSYAWDIRGDGFANSVPPAAWPVFSDRLDKADAELTRAWQLDPMDSAAPDLMLTVELGQGKGRDRMELWYKRAEAANPEDFDAAQTKLEYLSPKWYGTPQDMLDFARQAFKEHNEHSHLRILIFNAHQNLAYMSGMQRYGAWQPDPNYWAQPGVWDDLHPLFESILQSCPPGPAVGWRSVYAIIAYHSHHYSEAAGQLELLDGQFDPRVIHSVDDYNKLLASAKRMAASPPSSPTTLPTGQL